MRLCSFVNPCVYMTERVFVRVLLCLCMCVFVERKCAVRPERAEKEEVAHARTGTTVTMPNHTARGGARRRRGDGDGTSSADTDMDAPVWRAFPEQSWELAVCAAVVSCFRWIVVFREKPTRGRQRRRSGAREERITKLTLSRARRLGLPFSARRVYTARLSATPGNTFLSYAALSPRTDAPHPSCVLLSLK